MKFKLKTLFGITLLALALILPVLPLMVGTSGCTTSQQRVSYNTLYSLEKTTTAAYDAYMAQVIQGKVPTNDVPGVSKAYNAFQASMLVALDTVQFNTNALAPANLTVASQDLITLIESIGKATQKPVTKGTQ